MVGGAFWFDIAAVLHISTILMMRLIAAIILSSLPFALLSCSAKSDTNDAVDASVKRDQSSTTALRGMVSYWPLDYDVDKKDTLLRIGIPYKITVTNSCLNDSAVVNIIAAVNPVTEERGEVSDISHNYKSDLTILRGGKPWLHETLTKELFKNDSAAQRLGPLQQLVLSHTAFLRHEQGRFIFYTRLSVPDSDMLIEAEVEVGKGQKARIRKVMSQEEGGE
jgi:hypothetical protein